MDDFEQQKPGRARVGTRARADSAQPEPHGRDPTLRSKEEQAQHEKQYDVAHKQRSRKLKAKMINNVRALYIIISIAEHLNNMCSLDVIPARKSQIWRVAARGVQSATTATEYCKSCISYVA